MQINRRKVTKKDLRDFIMGKYFVDEENKLPWQPFEDYPRNKIIEFVNTDIQELISFLEIKG